MGHKHSNYIVPACIAIIFALIALNLNPFSVIIKAAGLISLDNMNYMKVTTLLTNSYGQIMSFSPMRLSNTQGQQFGLPQTITTIISSNILDTTINLTKDNNSSSAANTTCYNSVFNIYNISDCGFIPPPPPLNSSTTPAMNH
jgi:hypothetical protein